MSELLYAFPVALGIVPSLAFRAFALRRIFEVEDAPRRPAALVLGAALRDPTTPTTLLVHRLEAARRTLEREAVERLVLTGLPDEVAAMRAWLVARGVSEARLVVDSRSARTRESFAWARRELGFGAISVVTNPFHLPRALFLARTMGLDAIGIAARPGTRVSRRTMIRNHLRESVASVRAVWDTATRR